MSFIHSFIGECYSEDDKAGGIFLQNISLLAGGNPFGHTKKSTNQEYFGKFVAIESPEDVFAIRRAEVIHTICWYSLKYYSADFVRYLF
jgi:separase